MGAPEPGMEAAEQPAAATLLTAFKTISAAERRRHASVLNYWLSIRGDKEFPPLHDLDPLEISDAGPFSVLLELISGGHDAEVRHIGDTLKTGDPVERIMDAPSPSILASIAKKLPIVAISRDFLAFEDEYSSENGSTRCWITLLPLSAGGAWVDYVYAVVSVETDSDEPAEAEEPRPEESETEEVIPEIEPAEDVAPVEVDAPADDVRVEAEAPETVAEEVEQPFAEPVVDGEGEVPADSATAEDAKSGPGFAKLFDSIAGLAGFYGHSVKVEPVIAVNPAVSEDIASPSEDLVTEQAADDDGAEEPAVIEDVAGEQPAEELVEIATPESEGPLQSKLTEVRALADEARMAKLRANAALYQGLGAAYDFAIDAEESPEEYLRLVQAQGLKIQLRSPMTPVVKLAFDGLCDDSTIAQLEAVLTWALEQDLPRGALPARIEEAGGIVRVLTGESQPS